MPEAKGQPKSWFSPAGFARKVGCYTLG